MKYDVFISYSRKDTALADQICAAFDKTGISYFIDKQGIGEGIGFPKILEDNILDSQVFLFIASKNSYESTFTDREITFAFKNKRGENLIPYIIDDTPLPKHLELIFSSNNWRFLSHDPINALIEDIFSLLGRDKAHSNASQPLSSTTNHICTNQAPQPRGTIMQEFPEYGFVPTSLILTNLLKKSKVLKTTKKILWISTIIATVLLLIFILLEFPKLNENDGTGLFEKIYHCFDTNDTETTGYIVVILLYISIIISVFNKVNNAHIYRGQKYSELADYIPKNWRHKSISIFVKNRKFGVFQGPNIAIPAEYDKLSWMEKGKILVAEQNGESFLIDITGHRLN